MGLVLALPPDVSGGRLEGGPRACRRRCQEGLLVGRGFVLHRPAAALHATRLNQQEEEALGHHKIQHTHTSCHILYTHTNYLVVTPRTVLSELPQLLHLL